MKKRNSHTDTLFTNLIILKIHQIYLYPANLFVYKYHHALLPDIFNNFFTRNNSFHSYNTRGINNFRPPVARSSTAARHIKVSGVRTYNYFLERLNINSSYLSYKVSLRIYLIKNKINDIEDI